MGGGLKLRYSTVAPAHTFRLRLGWGLGFRVGTGVGEGLKLRHSNVAPTHTFRLRLGWDWGLGWGLGWGEA